MMRSVTTGSLAILIAGMVPATAHAATALGNMDATAELGITTPEGVNVGDFNNVIPDEDIDTSGSGLGETTTGTVQNDLFRLTTFAEATAGPATGSAEAARSNEGDFSITNTTGVEQTITFTLDWALEGEADITSASLDSAASFGSVSFSEGGDTSLFYEELSLTGVVGGDTGDEGGVFSLDFTLGAEDTASFDLTTSSQAEAASVIPLPAGLPLLLAGLGALALLRRTRRG